MGYVYRRLGDIKQALQSFEKATILDPRSAVTFMHLGTAYALLKDYDQAEKYLKHGIVLSPDEPMLYGYLAKLQVWRSGDIETALRILGEASQKVAIEGFIANAWWNIDILAGNYPDALDRISSENVFNTGEFQYFKPYLYGLMGDRESERQHYQLALAELEGLAVEGNSSAWFHVGLGWVYAGLGRMQEAIAEADEAGRLAPMSKDSMKGFGEGYKIAQIYALAGYHEKALEQLELIMSCPLAFANWTRLDPAFAVLRQNSRFQNLPDGG
jgi:tetratricopeptide (TPR) repeat protein